MTMNKTLNMNDDENLKAQSKIKDAVDYYRFSSGKCFTRYAIYSLLVR